MGDAFSVPFILSCWNGFKYRLNSTIYQWNGQEFVVFQNVATRGARILIFLKISIEPFLSVVNVYHENNQFYHVDSVTYKWRNNSFDEFQKLLKNGHYGASAAFVIKNETIIAVAAQTYFYVFKWSGEKFFEVQFKKTYGARDVKSFKMNGQLFLAIVNFNKNHFVTFTGATFVLATHVEGSFSSTSLSGDMKIFFIANIL